MAYLIDTSILVRRANTTDADHAAATTAVLGLHRRGEVLHLTPQVLVEFRGVATRPKALNGLGLPPADRRDTSGRIRGEVPSAGRDAGHLPGMEGSRGRAGDHRQAGS